MADITPKLIKELRDKTNAGMADCKKALESSAGDIEKAIQWLREKGIASASKRADKETNEGFIQVELSADKKTAAIIELNCETDFVAKGQDFTNTAKELASLALKTKSETSEALSTQAFKDDIVSNIIIALGAKVGEKIVLKKVVYKQIQSGSFVPYIHFGSKLLTLVEFSTNGKSVDKIGKDIAMQIAATSPIAINRNEVKKDEIEKEIEVLRNQAKNEGKPPAVVEKIVNGRLEKFYQENVLLEQMFIKDSTKTIKELLADTGEPVEIKSFIRLQVGE